MYYYKARLYSPTLGRFLQTDPVGYKDQFNLYAYVGNDPVNKTDPSGETATWGSSALQFVNSVIDEARQDPIGTGILVGSIIVDIADSPVSPGPDASIVGASVKAERAIARTEAKAAQSESKVGSYTNTHESGATYSGKGSRERSQASGKRVEKATGDKHVATNWSPSKST